MSLAKKAIGGSIHRIREFELEKVNLAEEFDILQIVGEGWFGKILLTEHRSTQIEMVLKALPKPYTGISDFYREFHYGLHLSAHRNIITTYDVAFETAGFYVFGQEYAPLGDLTSNVTETGLGELHAKRVARQLAAAVHHIHSRELVHRDIKLDNILVFKSDFSRIKLCDFGETRRVNTVVRRHNEWLPYSPPEVLQIDTDEAYKALTAHDVWQFGIVIFVCLTGCLPWQKAAADDPRYAKYHNWHTATLNMAKKPKLFQLISSRAQRMFKRLLDPRLEKRPPSVFEVNKYLEDRWLAKLGAEKALNGGADERDELCPSMYSFHSSLEEKNQLLFTLTQYGIETTVDRSKKKDRIREWIQSSAIAEENEEEEESDAECSSETADDEGKRSGGPRLERATPGMEGRRGTMFKPNDVGERKNPFAPQVAQERQTIARLANYPKGDPELAVGMNGNASPRGGVEERSTAESEEQRRGGNHRGSPGSTERTERSVDESSTSGPRSSVEKCLEGPAAATARGPQVVDSGEPKILERVTAPRTPLVPVRKHRSQTVPFLVSSGPEANERSHPARRSQSATLAQNSRAPQSRATYAAPRSTASRRLPSEIGVGGKIESYGKDAYEHYGIAQGAVMRVNGANWQRDSTGSGSRSASN